MIRARLENVAVSGPRATAKMTDGASNAGPTFFVKEEDRWRVDLAPMAAAVDQVLQRMARDSGRSEDEFIFSSVGSVSGRRVTDAIWQPLE
jgi:hypothetical protein